MCVSASLYFLFINIFPPGSSPHIYYLFNHPPIPSEKAKWENMGCMDPFTPGWDYEFQREQISKLNLIFFFFNAVLRHLWHNHVNFIVLIPEVSTESKR